MWTIILLNIIGETLNKWVIYDTYQTEIISPSKFTVWSILEKFIREYEWKPNSPKQNLSFIFPNFALVSAQKLWLAHFVQQNHYHIMI